MVREFSLCYLILNTWILQLIILTYYLYSDIPTSLTIGHYTSYCTVEKLQGNFCPKAFTVEDWNEKKIIKVKFIMCLQSIFRSYTKGRNKNKGMCFVTIKAINTYMFNKYKRGACNIVLNWLQHIISSLSIYQFGFPNSEVRKLWLLLSLSKMGNTSLTHIFLSEGFW